MNDTKKKTSTWLSVLGIVLLIAGVVGISYAMFQTNLEGTKENTITTGSITLNYVESGTAITLVDGEGFGLTEQQGKDQTEYFEFSVNANSTGNVTIGYYIYIDEITTTLPASAIKLYLTTVDGVTETPVLTDNMNNSGANPALASTFTNVDVTNTSISYSESSNYRALMFDSFTFNNGVANPNSRTYRLRMWADSEYVQTITYAGTCSDPSKTTPTECRTAGGTWTDTTTDTHQASTTGQSYAIKLHVFGIDEIPTKIIAS